jgi:hypothetical protein
VTTRARMTAAIVIARRVSFFFGSVVRVTSMVAWLNARGLPWLVFA